MDGSFLVFLLRRRRRGYFCCGFRCGCGCVWLYEGKGRVKERYGGGGGDNATFLSGCVLRLLRRRRRRGISRCCKGIEFEVIFICANE
jgi:hypothetical protein